ncbi:contractile injection system protein, VgrG/Pvc8 family, partial [Helicobacter sp. T3_23-1059]
LNKAYRIYTHKTPIEVLQATLRFYENALHKHIDFSRISFPYPKEELITQYNESDLDFIFRIAHNNGIYFYEDSSTIYFYDFLANGIHSINNHLNASNSNETNKSTNNTMGESKFDSNESKNNIIQTILFNPNPNNTQNLPCINSLYKSQTLLTKTFSQSTHSALNPYELHSLSSHFNPNNANSHNDSYNNSIENLNNALYSTHIYNSQYSFSDISNNINTPLSIATSRATMLYNTFKAKSNIYDLSLNQCFRINLEHSTSTKEQSLQDFYIIEIKQMLINESLLENNINTNDNII